MSSDCKRFSGKITWFQYVEYCAGDEGEYVFKLSSTGDKALFDVSKDLLPIISTVMFQQVEVDISAEEERNAFGRFYDHSEVESISDDLKKLGDAEFFRVKFLAVKTQQAKQGKKKK